MAQQGNDRDGSLPLLSDQTSQQAAPPRSVTEADTPAERFAPPPAEPALGAPPREGGRVASPDDYDVLREYARGGLGRILEARDTRLDRIVALKELKREHPIARARFAREVRVTARLQHPNIVPIHEAGEWPSGAAFYSMKLVEGKTLAQAVTDCTTPAERFALLPAVLDVARAVAYAHSQRIIHRDLKPANVLVGPFGETVVIDWGLAKDLDEPIDDNRGEELGAEEGGLFATRFGAVVGTPSYMPPEQAAGEHVDERADVYALGALLYYVISGRSPYDDVPQGDVLDRVVEAPPLPLERHVPDTPPDLLAIVGKAMARDRNDRYQTAQDLLDELERYAAGRLVEAYRYRASDLAARFVKKHRAAVITGTLALMALLTVATLFIAELTAERDRARKSAESERGARAVAERRVDELLVVKARSLLDSDPTLAAAWLKRLKSVPEGAATVAGRAQDRGVARHVLRGHADLVWSVAVASDGSTVATGSHDKTLRLWDVSTGSSRTFTGHTERVTEIAFAPDNRRIASASYDGTIRLTETTSGVGRVLGRHAAPVKRIAFSQDGGSIASVGEDGSVSVWALTGSARSVFKEDVDRDLFVALSKNGKALLSGSHRGSLRLWNLEGGAHKLLVGHTGPVVSGVLSPDGLWAASAGEDGTVRLWNLEEDTSETLFRGSSAMLAVAFSRNGKWLAAAGHDGAVRLFDLGSREGAVVATHGERVEHLLFSPDDRQLVSAGWDKVIRVVDLATRATRTLLGHTDVIASIAFSADGRILVSGSWDKTARVWILDGTPTDRTLYGHRVGVRSVAVAPRGEWIASTGHDNTVRLWKPDGSEMRLLTGHTDHVYRAAFSPDGQLLASSSDDQTVRVWTVSDGRSRVLIGHAADVEELAFSPDGSRLVSASEDDTARLWTLGTGHAQTLPHGNDVTAVAFSPNGERVATASRDGLVRLWDGRSGEPESTLAKHPDEVWTISYSPDGGRFASASVDGTVQIRSSRGGPAQTLTGLHGARLLAFSPDGSRLAVAGIAPRAWICVLKTATCRELRGHRALVRDLLFVPNRDLLATASGDATVQIWDLSTTERRILEGHVAPVFDLAAMPDGSALVSAGGDATVRIWPVREPPSNTRLMTFLEALTTETAEERSGDLTAE